MSRIVAPPVLTVRLERVSRGCEVRIYRSVYVPWVSAARTRLVGRIAVDARVGRVGIALGLARGPLKHATLYLQLAIPFPSRREWEEEGGDHTPSPAWPLGMT